MNNNLNMFGNKKLLKLHYYRNINANFSQLHNILLSKKAK